jgi:hypothetical protein
VWCCQGSSGPGLQRSCCCRQQRARSNGVWPNRTKAIIGVVCVLCMLCQSCCAWRSSVVCDTWGCLLLHVWGGQPQRALCTAALCRRANWKRLQVCPTLAQRELSAACCLRRQMRTVVGVPGQTTRATAIQPRVGCRRPLFAHLEPYFLVAHVWGCFNTYPYS